MQLTPVSSCEFKVSSISKPETRNAKLNTVLYLPSKTPSGSHHSEGVAFWREMLANEKTET